MTINTMIYLSVLELPLLPWEATASSKSHAWVLLLQSNIPSLHFLIFFARSCKYIFSCLVSYLPLRTVQADRFIPHQIAILVESEKLVGNKTLGAFFKACRTRRLGGMGPRSPSRLLKASKSREDGLEPSEKLSWSRQKVFRPHIVEVPVEALALQILSQSKSLWHILPCCCLFCMAVHPVEEPLVLVHPRQRQSRQVGVQDGADTSVPGERVGARLAEHVADLVSN